MASFADRARARMASITSNPMPDVWDDDFADDLLFKASTAASLSSRMSVRSESNTGEDDSWQVLITPDNAPSTAKAVSSAAQQAGIPIPSGVPSSALLGGSIKRLGKKKSSRRIAVDEDWANDIDLGAAMGGLKLKVPKTPAEDSDDFDWGESSLNSLGIRFAGTRARGSSVSAMSSCIESDDDDLSGLILPEKPLDFNARLEKLKKTEYLPTPDSSPYQQVRKSPLTSAPTSAFAQAGPSSPTAFKTPSPLQSPLREHRAGSAPKPQHVDEDFSDLDFGAEPILTLKRNRNVVVKESKPAPAPAARATSTLTFTNHTTSSRIPRPLPTTKTRLQPVYETGAPTQRHSRPMPTTTSAQLLKSKRSAPVLRNNNAPHSRPLPSSSTQTHHVTTRASQPHLRRESDPRRPQSPAMRTYSRLSGETPSRAGNRKEMNPSALARNPPPRKITTPQRKQVFGNGNELDRFDDLPTSAAKEKPFVKMPSNKSLRQQPSSSRLPMPDRMQTPLPQTPRSPPSIPRFAQDTVSSRQRLAGTRSRAEGPIAPRPTSWAAQVAARSPHASPNAHRKKGSGQQPRLIRQMTSPIATTTEQGMVYNPTLQTWQGNEEILLSFNHPNTSTTTLALTTASTPTFVPHGHPLNRTHDRSHSISHTALASIQASQKNMSFSSRTARLASARTPPAPAPAPAPVPSPPRPALISQISAPRTIQVEGKMFYDPIKMTWLKTARRSNDPMSPSEMDDEEDPFAGMDDLKDEASIAGGNSAGGAGSAELDPIMEAYDVGPGFIRRQRDEEVIWRRKVDGWVGGLRDEGNARGGWRWLIRDMATSAGVSSY